MERLAALILILMPALAHAGELTVVGVHPVPHSLTASVSGPITVTFDRPLLTSSVVMPQTVWAWGRWSGMVNGTLSFGLNDTSVVLTPTAPLSAGELVTVHLGHDLQAADGSVLRPAGYSFQFWTRAGEAALVFDTVAVLSTNLAGESSRPYGGVGADLDNDGWLDLAMVNEDTSDVRVFLNSADGSGSYGAIVQPTAGVGNVPSPSEPADFDRDGVTDLVTANIAGSSVSILRGLGDGTFAPHQTISVGTTPRGVAVLDADGDADLDIACASVASNGTLAVLLNDGAGGFGPPAFFDGGGTGEWALVAVDTDNDGVLDLVVGRDGAIATYRGNGDGTFTAAGSTPYSGRAWMIVAGDVNGDGAADIAAVNTSASQILLGNGLGQFGAPQSYPTDPFSLATDLGDLDGDGDLDWVSASFGGDWFFYTNDGDGTFTFDRAFAAPAAASCSLVLDIDNDRDLDLALIDEIADEVVVLRNVGSPAVPALGSLGVAVLSGAIVAAGVWVMRRRRLSRVGPALLLAGGMVIDGGCTAAPPTADPATATVASEILLPPSRTGRFFVGSFEGDEIIVYAADGTPQTTFTVPDLDGPRGILATPDGQLFIASQHTDRILRFDLDGTLQADFGAADLDGPTGMARSAGGALYVSSFDNNRVVVFDLSGQFLRSFTADGLRGPNCVALDAAGAIYVASAGTGEVFKFDAAERYITRFTGGGLSSPMSIARAGDDTLYVSGGASHNIVRFDTAGRMLGELSHPDLSGPQGIAFDDRGHLFCSSFFMDTIVEYDGDGAYVRTIRDGALDVPRSIAFARGGD